jgi:hypothetical protein
VTPATATKVTGTERLEWTQAVVASRDVSTYRYAAYVDGVRVELREVSCKPPSSPASTDFECIAPLPPMSAGAHGLELAMFIVDGSTMRESPRSAPMTVIKAAGEATRGSR